jgi:hypothetical protein
VEQVRDRVDNYHRVKDHLEKISEIKRELLRRERGNAAPRKRKKRRQRIY